mgnify:FL=1
MEEKNNIIINQVDPTTFEYQEYSEQDNNLIDSRILDTSFTSSSDYIEYYIYDNSKNLLFPNQGEETRIYDQREYSVIEGDTILYPAQNLENIGYDSGTFYSTYNFYKKRLTSDQFANYYICEISSDRTELRLKSSTIPSDLIISSSQEFIEYRENADYFVDFFLNFGNDQQAIANNLRLDVETEVEPSVLIKLYEPLPPNFTLKSTLWVVEEISSPQAYKVTFPEEDFIPNDFQLIKGPNYSISVTQQTGEASQNFNYNTLLSTNVTSSFDQLKNILNRKEININVNYEDYKEFVHFSSAQTRLENFYYKVGLIQSSNTKIGNLPTTDGLYSASKAELTTSITKVIEGFDGYEYFMYYNSGSLKSYPKSNTEPPYILEPTTSTIIKTWLGSADPENAYYGGQALSSSDYDENNQDYLYNSIPEYLRSDPNNAKYELFVDMVAQQYDNTWLYTKNITTRFDADNRLDYGISKDLVADAIRDFGIKLYSNNFNSNDLYTSFLGLTPSGSTFPFPYMTGSIGGAVATPSGYEYVTTQISASNDIVPLDDVNKRLYKRIYHNIPYLLKTKGTVAGLRALITSYGIPDTILRINEFGGKDRNDFQDWDYSENVYNYAFHADGGVNSYITSSFVLNQDFPNSATAPRSMQFRFKTPGLPDETQNPPPYYYNIWKTDQNKSNITLEYSGTGLTSGSYSGSVPALDNQYGKLTFWPDGANNTNDTASITLPFFDGGWWSAMVTVDYNNSEKAILYAANRIGDKIGFTGSDSTTYTWQYYATSETSSFSEGTYGLNGNNYIQFTGAFQEIRYWDIPLSESLFYDYVVNPYSTQGNTINSTPLDLAFRADLGTQLITSSRTSIHPKVTGSWATTSSFRDDSSFYVQGNFIENTEEIYLNQVPGGIKNRISDQIKIDQEVLPLGDTLSPYISIQQSVFPSGSNPSINYLEVAFSPTDQTNDDIIAQIGAFNLGDYIGDPRQISESGYSYSQLDRLRDEYFTKYIDSYDVNDFVRLIKFFDNSLFKMLEDFTPARTSLSSGVVIKQNLLERNRQRPAQVSSAVTMSTYFENTPSDPFSEVVPIVQKDQVLEGTVLSQARDFNPGSNDYPQNNKISGSSIYVFDGGTGGVFDPFNNIYNAPISTSIQETCLPFYSYSSSNDLTEAEYNYGTVLFSSTVGTSTNTMSFSIYNEQGGNNVEFFNSLTSSISQSEIFLNLGIATPHPLTGLAAGFNGTNITHQIDFIDILPDNGYGDAQYGNNFLTNQNTYGYQTTASFIAHLTVISNGPPAILLKDEDELSTFCFVTSGSPYSGKTGAEVSASLFGKAYPGVIQDMEEIVYPTMGTNFPIGSSKDTNLDSYGQGPLTIERIDQREFYNGEFPNTIDVKLKDICGAFFGQDDVPDYQFYINFFNKRSFPESSFLSPDNLPLKSNIWLWADTLSDPRMGSNNSLPVLASPQFTNQTSAITSNFVYSKISGNGAEKGRLYLESGVGEGAGFEIISAYFVAGADAPKDYEGGGVITVTAAELTNLGFNISFASLDLSLSLPTQILDPIPTNKVKYIKISNSDINGVTILPFIQDSEYLILNLTGASDFNNTLIEGYQTWYISNASIQNDNIPATEDATLLIINEPPSSDAVSSFDSQFVDLTFSASGVFNYYATSSGVDPTVTPNINLSESIAQGYFPPTDRSPGFPTESFFRGWDDASYLQADDDGDIYRVSSGTGFNTDLLGNFNTGSREFDADEETGLTAGAVNAKSTVPWFMNAQESLTQVLDKSSLVGDLGQTDLQLYTGSITASSVEIGLTLNMFDDQAPIYSPTVIIGTLTQPPLPFITVNSPNNLSSVPNFPNSRYPITVTATLSTINWTISTIFDDGSNWFRCYTTPTGNTVINSGQGTLTVYLDIDVGGYGSNYNSTERSGRLKFTNQGNINNNLSVYIDQDVWGDTGSGNQGFQP